MNTFCNALVGVFCWFAIWFVHLFFIFSFIFVLAVQARSSYKCHLMQHPLHDWMPTAFPPPGASHCALHSLCRENLTQHFESALRPVSLVGPWQ